MNIQDHIKKRFENETPLPIRTTISKTKLLSWVRQQQKHTEQYPESLCYEVSRNRWIIIREAIEKGEFDV